MTRPFRFGVVAPVLTDMPTWRDQVRRIADSGYSTLLMPDVPQWQPAPAPTLAMAAAQTDLRVGTWVYASPCARRGPPPGRHTRCRCSPRVASRWASAPADQGSRTNSESSACPSHHQGSGWPRCVRLWRRCAIWTAPHVHTPVVMAVRGPKARALALDVADTVTVAALTSDTRAAVAAMARDLRAVRDVELALHVPVVGDTVAPFMASARDTDPTALREADSLAVLPDDPAAAAEEIQRRREEIGYSYFVFGADSAEVLTPMVATLAGQ